VATIETDTVPCTAAGTTLRGFRAVDTARSGKRPGVLVVHEWWGLNDYVRRRARMLAELGYAAFAADMYGDGRTAADPGEAGALMNGVLSDMETGEARLRAALERLQADPAVDPGRLAGIGYCFGGAMVLHAARIGLPLGAVVSFHGALGSFHRPAPGSVKAKVLVCHGGDDSLVPEAELEAFKREMDAARADYRIISYPGAKHGFTNPDAEVNAKRYGIPLGYDPEADHRSWADMQEHFRRAL
jgi:dienelactone hydrolase